MAEATTDTIKEGFLCPVCHKDLRSPNSLLAHFQDLHSEEQDLLKSIKDLVGKAKSKILKLDEQQLESFKSEISRQKYYIEYSEPQEPGQCRSHTELFKTIRRERLDHRTTETNKLIIRLDKLLHVDGSDRKQKEQELVTWLDGTTVTRCPSCAANFNITRRQHHCRLCGSIMCNSCSFFLSYDTAKIIVAPVYTESNAISDSTPKNETDSLRICDHCMNMLENRRCVQMLQVVKPLICQLYSNLQRIKSELQPSLDLYEKMYNSLTSGDTTFQLQDAEALRSSIAKQATILDKISNKILAIPPDPEYPKAVLLQTAVRRATSQYIKEYLLVLPMLPSPAELDRIKKERALRRSEIPQTVGIANVKKVAVTTGWSPDNITEEVIPETSEDPLIQQINIVRNYIQQARKAHRFEEVASLQENLNLLEAYQMQLRDGRVKYVQTTFNSVVDLFRDAHGI